MKTNERCRRTHYNIDCAMLTIEPLFNIYVNTKNNHNVIELLKFSSTVKVTIATHTHIHLHERNWTGNSIYLISESTKT